MNYNEALLDIGNPGIKACRTIADNYLPLITVKPLRYICDSILQNPLFIHGIGSAGKHHAYQGGLAVHTKEVVQYACGMAEMFPDADMDVIITAAVFHDYMKIKEYVMTDNVIRKTSYRNLVRHVAGSHAEFMKAVYGRDIASDIIMKIEHTILAHHGRPEWGSPMEPQLIEAHILHYADVLSAGFGLDK